MRCFCDDLRFANGDVPGRSSVCNQGMLVLRTYIYISFFYRFRPVCTSRNFPSLGGSKRPDNGSKNMPKMHVMLSLIVRSACACVCVCMTLSIYSPFKFFTCLLYANCLVISVLVSLSLSPDLSLSLYMSPSHSPIGSLPSAWALGDGSSIV